MKNNKDIIIGIAISFMIVAGLIFWSQSLQISASSAAKNIGPGPLTTAEQSFDFGTISMAAGKVSHVFAVKNNGSAPSVVERIYTSCMCTEASLIVDGEKLGPFGMEGMGFNPVIKKAVPPGTEAQVEVVFDPAAHGPAGVGKISRVISVEQVSAAPLEFQISANVIP